MPALFLADSPTSKEVKESKFKQPKKKDSMSPERNGSAEENKLSKKKKTHSNPEDGDVKKKKKRKSVEEDDATADAVKPAASKKVAENGLPKKARIMEDEKDDRVLDSIGDEDGEDADPNDLNNFRISKILKERLNSKGIKALFPIQAMTFDMILDGSDLVGRARTGQENKNRVSTRTTQKTGTTDEPRKTTTYPGKARDTTLTDIMSPIREYTAHSDTTVIPQTMYNTTSNNIFSRDQVSLPWPRSQPRLQIEDNTQHSNKLNTRQEMQRYLDLPEQHASITAAR